MRIRGHSVWTIAGLVAALTACAPVPAPVTGPIASSMPTAPADDARTVADILQKGAAAQARGDGRDLMAQARALDSIAARPQDGDPDLARQWTAQAQALGVPMPVSNPFRGRTLGPAYRSGRVAAGGSFHTRQNFNAGHRAEIVVVPVDAARLSLLVRDDDGASICTLAPSTGNLGCRWVPAFTGASDIEVRNEMNQPVSFYMVLN